MAILRVDPIRSIAGLSITGSYTAVGTPLQHALRMFRIINNTNGDVYISFDGTTDNLYLPTGTFVLYDVSTNAVPIGETDNLLVGIGTQFYVKEYTSVGSGVLMIEGLYARGN